MNEEESKRSLVAQTGQAGILLMEQWSLYLGFALLLAPLLAPKASAWIVVLPIAGLAIGLGGFIYACIAVRCPACGQRWFWEAVSRKSPFSADDWVRGLVACTACGFSGDKSVPVSKLPNDPSP